jgi:protein TonB
MIRDRAEPAIEALAALLTAVPAALILYARVNVLVPPAPVASPPVTVALSLQPAPAPAPAPPQPASPLREATAPEAAPAPVHLPVMGKAPRPVRRHRMAMVTAALPDDAVPGARTVPAPAPAPRAAPQVADPNADALYTGLVHQTVERHKRNPGSAAYRLLHPSGTVAVMFTISRGGAVSDVQVVAGSGADMLDRQAASIVAGCVFPPMPAAAFAGSATHRFQVQITFPPPYQVD